MNEYPVASNLKFLMVPQTLQGNLVSVAHCDQPSSTSLGHQALAPARWKCSRFPKCSMLFYNSVPPHRWFLLPGLLFLLTLICSTTQSGGSALLDSILIGVSLICTPLLSHSTPTELLTSSLTSRPCLDSSGFSFLVSSLDPLPLPVPQMLMFSRVKM